MPHTLGTKVDKENDELHCALSFPPLWVILLPLGHYDRGAALDLRAPVAVRRWIDLLLPGKT